MSLVPHFVRMKNGKWYKDATIFDNTQNWFLCFDDDDPPEIVIKQDKQLSKVERLKLIKETLMQAGINADVTSHHPGGKRLFPPDWEGFSDAISAFIKINCNIAVDNLKVKHEGIFIDLPSDLCGYVAYDFNCAGGGIGGTDVENLEKLAKWLNPFGE